MFIVSDEMKLRAVQDFEPGQITRSEKTELIDILKALSSEKSSLLKSEIISHRSDGIHCDYNAAVIPFKRGDQMKTILPADSG